MPQTELEPILPPDPLEEGDFIPYQSPQTLPAGKVLVLAPHPDDEVFGCGGAIMQHKQQGDAVDVLIVTDGAAAEHPDEVGKAEYIARRQAESQCAAQILGYGEARFWNYADRELARVEDLAQRVRDALEASAAETVYAPSVHEIHPDHYALARAAALAVSGTHRRLLQYEVGVPCAPNLLLDISPFLERKQKALSCFASQLSIQEYAKHINGLEHYRTYTLGKGAKAAEAYYLIEGRVLATEPWRVFGHSRQNLRFKEVLGRLSALEETAQTQQALLKQMENGLSWRMTAPLRKFRRLLGL